MQANPSYKPNPRPITTTNKPTILTQQPKMISMHLIDGIYEGFVNASYQRDGFGILQTNDFLTYIGYFKFNKLHGLGMVVYTDGSIIYGNFRNGQFQGIGLADNGLQLQIGTFKGPSMVGIGYEYSYKTCGWKMNTYHKGVAIQVIKEETLSLKDGIPNILTLQSQILSLYLNYSRKSFFSRLELCKQNQTIKEQYNNIYVHHLSQTQYYLGIMIDNKFQGLGLLFSADNKTISQVGIYRQGKLNGFGMKIDLVSRFEEIGFYIDGKKDGIFFVKKSGAAKFCEYSKGTLIVQDKRGEKFQDIRKRQKIHYYRQKDFMSMRTGLDFHALKCIFESSEYRAWKVQQQNDKKTEMIKAAQGNKKLKTTPPSHTSIHPSLQGHEKTSIQIMKEKIYNLMTQKENKKGEKTQMMFQKQPDGTDESIYERKNLDDDIAIEQNPVQAIYPNYSKRKAVSFREMQLKRK